MIRINRLSLLIVLCCCFPVAVFASDGAANPGSVEKMAQEIDIAHINKDALSHLSKEEQEWYQKFQNGLLFFDGWQQISNEILSSLAAEEKEETRSLLQTIGVKIGTEWCKDNDVRKINTDQLHNWGKRLRTIRSDEPTLLPTALRTISVEVDDLLSEKENTPAEEETN